MGRSYLMSPPASYGVHHLLNPWMAWHESVDLPRAYRQWEGLVKALEDAGADVELVEPIPESGAMTFTRDPAVVAAPRRAVMLRNVGPRGDVEPAAIAPWLRRRGFTVDDAPERGRIDGGNVIATRGRWLIGMPPGAGRDELDHLADVLADLSGRPAVGIPLVGDRYGHLDMAMADLGDRAWLLYPPALGNPELGNEEWKRVLGEKPLLIVDDHEAEQLACNVVVVDDTVIGGGLTPRLCRELARVGFRSVSLELDEFRKAGGGAHCLVLGLFAPQRSSEGEEIANGTQDDSGRGAHRRRSAVRGSLP